MQKTQLNYLNWKDFIFKVIIILISTHIIAFAYNMFLLPHNILSGGFTGIAMMLGYLFNWNKGLLLFLLNVPLFIIGFMKLGKKFIFLSVLAVSSISVAMQYIPLEPIAQDPIISCVFGGLLVGLGSGLVLKVGSSTGGLDIISLIIALKKDISIGTMILTMNGMIVFIAGFIYDWDIALLTLVQMFATSKIIDTVHTKHIKLTAMIITTKCEEVREAMLNELHRGCTIVDAEGGYTHANKKILITVITRHQLSDLKKIIRRIDNKSFVNITETIDLVGSFKKLD